MTFIKRLRLFLLFSLLSFIANQTIAKQLDVKCIQSDSIKIDSLINVAGNYRFSNPDTAIIIINSAIKLATQDSLYRQMLVAMRRKGVFYILNSNFDSSVVVFFRAIPLAEKYQQIDILIRIYINLGIVYTKMGDFIKSESYYDRVIEEYGDSLDLKTRAIIYNNLGLMYFAKGDYVKSLKAHQEALKIREESKDSLSLASTIMNIANIHFYQEKYSDAIEKYLEACNIYHRYNYVLGIQQSTHNLGTIYEKLDSLSLAEKYLNEALKYEPYKMSIRNAKTLNMLGLVSMKEGKYNQAKEYFLESLEVNKKIHSTTQIIPSLNNLADLYNRMGKPNIALRYSKQALRLVQNSGAKSIIRDVYFNMYKSYEQLAKYKNALKYYEDYNLLKDSIFGIEKHKQIQELEIKYKTSEKEREISEKNAEIVLKELEAKKKDVIIRKEQIQKYSLILFVILIVIIFVVIYRNQQNKRKSALLLMQKNEEYNNQKISELIKRHQLDSIKGRLDAEERERHRIAQELHDGIGGSLAAIKLYVDSLRKKLGMKELDMIYDNINLIYEQVRSLSHNLTPPEFKLSSISDVVKDYVHQFSKQSKTEIILNSEANSDWSTLDESIQIGIYRIIQELMSNVIKHAQASRVICNMKLKEEYVEISVQDNGKGFDTNKKVSGIGLRNINKRVSDLNGDIEINSELGKGTEVRLIIPI